MVGNFQIVRPAFELDQEETLRWIAAIHAKAGKTGLLKLLLKVGCGKDKIQRRGLSVADFSHQRWDEMEIYPDSLFGKRSAHFDQIATGIIEKFYPHKVSFPDHLIHVTCTGYVAPSPAQKVVSKREATTSVTHAYHMGCYAAIPALRMAMNFPGTVDIVHTEVCSLHLHPSLHEIEQLIVQTLFADGFIKYTTAERGFKILNLADEIIPDSTETMAWSCTEWGLKMKLAKDVPTRIANALPSFVKKLLGFSPKGPVYFAIHPGGPRVIEQIAKILNLKQEQFAHSKAVLQNYGNMSSATLPHIWQALWHDQTVKKGSYVVSLAFGPGLTLAGALFQK
jgi:predicted naringenin-chalcone synthase